VGSVPDWYVNNAIGTDAPGFGLSAAAPFKTAEYLSSVLNPGGEIYEPTLAVVRIHFAAGQYGALDIKGRFPSSVPQYGAFVQILCEVALGPPIVLSAVVTGNSATSTRGQITTIGATNFVDKKRYIVLDGTQIGAVGYTCGQNASPQNFFCGPWGKYDGVKQFLTIPVGSSIALQNLLVSFQRVDMVWLGPGYCELRNAQIHGTLILKADFVGGTVDLIECELFGDAGASLADYFTDAIFASCQFVAGTFQFWRGTAFFQHSCQFESAAIIRARNGASLQFSRGDLFNGGRVICDAYGDVVFNADSEFENGTANAAILCAGGGLLRFPSGKVWGLAGAYATAIQVDSLGEVSYAAASQFAGPLIPATVQLSMTGHNLAIAASIPRSYDRAGCVFALSPDPAALATTT